MKNQSENFEIVVKTMQGLEEVLEAELTNLGATETIKHKRAVSFFGNKELLYKANLHLRTAIRILVPIYKCKVRNEIELYKRVQEVNWDEYLSNNDTLAIDSAIHSPNFNHSNYVSLKTKDAIVDQFRDRTGKRPSVDLDKPTIRVNIHINQEDCQIAIDSSGYSLHKRGYRINQNSAPLNEALAAGLVLLSGWNKDCDFYDPMCGSGTILMEAATYSRNIAPGKNRSFGFMNFKDFDAKLWDKIHSDAIANETEFNHQIYGSDISDNSIFICKNNVIHSGFDDYISIDRVPFEKLIPKDNSGLIITNPPYGERIQKDELFNFYELIGDTLKQKFKGFNAFILGGNLEAFKYIGLKPSRKYTLFNGTIECKFQKFEMYSGSKKAKYMTNVENQPTETEVAE